VDAAAHGADDLVRAVLAGLGRATLRRGEAVVRRGQVNPQLRDQITPAQLRQHTRVDLVGLARQRRDHPNLGASAM
jgi:hypothetical protein